MLLKLHESNCSRPLECGSGNAKPISFLPAIVAALLSVSALNATGQAGPGSSTATWQPINFGTNSADPFRDQQTGSAEADIIGTAMNPAFYIQHDGKNTGSASDDLIGFRLRLAADVNPVGYKGAAFVGIDANLDGALDLFVGVNNQGGRGSIGIWNPGTGLNISPNTTSIVSPPLNSYSETALNYGFISVSSTTDPNATSFDLDGGGKTDKFLSFFVPFADIVLALDARGVTGVSLNSPVQFIAATATQDNSLNQDLGGVNGGSKSSLSWSDLGAFSPVMTFGGGGGVSAAVPEPQSITISAMAGSMILFSVVRRRRVN